MQPRHFKRLARYAPILVAALGLLATLFVARQNIFGGNLKGSLDFEKEAMARAGLIETQLQGNLQSLRTLAGLWTSRADQENPILSENEFLSFIKHGLDLQSDTLGIYVIGNVPIGRENEYVNLLRSTNGTEWQDFQILSARSLKEDWLLEAPPGNRRLPLTYIWSPSDSLLQTALGTHLQKGLDVNEVQHLSGFVQRADKLFKTDEALVSIFFPDMMSTAPDQESTFISRFSAIVCIPKSTASGQLVASYVRMDFSTAALIERAIGVVDPIDMTLSIVNEDDRTSRSFMPFLSSQRPQFGSIQENARDLTKPEGNSFTHNIQFPNSQWKLIFEAKPGFYERSVYAAWKIVAIGLLVTLLMVSTTNLLVRRRDEILALVKKRTSQLTIANTELKKKHAELAAVNENLKHTTQEAQRANAAKSDFLATMSHEIRTPMNGVLGMASLLSKSDLDEDQKHKLSVITSCSHALLDILNDILDLSKVESGRLEFENCSFNFDALITELDHAWRPIFETKGIALSFQKEAWLNDHIVADATRVRQVFNNLISNALKFTETGEVRVVLSQSAHLPTQIVTHVTIQDTGIGIDPKAVPYIFEQFTQADASTTRKYGGTGLGLAICKNLLEHMGGAIDVDSKPGQGTTIWFDLPSGPAEIENAPSSEDFKQEIQPNQMHAAAAIRILVAEDNAVNQQLIKALLSTLPSGFDIAQNGQEAVEAVTARDYDVVLMDIQMPVMDGLEATEQIRRLETENADIPIIAMTANALAGDKEKYLAAGMTDYISKPLNPSLLIDKTVKLGTSFRDKRNNLKPAKENAASC